MRGIMIVYLLLLTLTPNLTAGQTVGDAEGGCIACHKEQSPGLYRQWFESAHGLNDVSCLECHSADQGDVDAFHHEGALIATLVTPNDCAQCHSEEARQTSESYHATAGLILDSNDAYLAHVVGGQPAAVAGCESCHGTTVVIDPDSPNKLDRLSWPNSGIGRLNPDGSKGACNACHSRHSFSAAQARQPETCGKCHLGPDHPQKEIYEESKHGIAYYTHTARMNLDADPWVVGVDYYEAPTCATCHMSATRRQGVTHDVGERISWTLRPPVSRHLDNWQQKRENMSDVCRACHHQFFIDGHYTQLDGIVHLFNEKFALPAGAIMQIIIEKKVMENPAAFSNEIEWIYWELWHHEGRRARHGAAMMAPDYTWWHGIYDVAHNFYFEFLPAAREFHDPDVDQYIDNLLANDPMHQWLNVPTMQLKKAIRDGELQKTYRDLFPHE
ncbi:MAG: hypothetical protein ISR91_05055 [Candidatus Delongbacteria bacterium]|nr:hypothetical protein [Candidatus Delongbacteria bacterium]